MFFDIYVSAFLDDVLGGKNTFEKTLLFMIYALDLIQNLAILFKVRKSVIIPTTVVKHLGFNLDVSKNLFLLTPKWRENIFDDLCIIWADLDYLADFVVSANLAARNCLRSGQCPNLNCPKKSPNNP